MGSLRATGKSVNSIESLCPPLNLGGGRLGWGSGPARVGSPSDYSTDVLAGFCYGVDTEDRYRRLPNNPFGDATQEEMKKPGSSMRTHDN